MAASVVLDTHVLVWVVAGGAPVTPAAVSLIERAQRGAAVHVAAITLWEIAMLSARGRLRLGSDAGRWLTTMLALPGVQLHPLSSEVAVEAYNLPGAFHGDPADRMIVATARLLDARLLTRDRSILRYAAEGHVQVLAA